MAQAHGDAEGTTRIVQGGCPHDCPDTCAWRVTVQNGRAVALQGDLEHPFTRGGLCSKVNHYIERVHSAQRLLHPLRRTGAKGPGQFERVNWATALDDIARRLQEIVGRDGASAILPYSYFGTQGTIQGRKLGRPVRASW